MIGVHPDGLPLAQPAAVRKVVGMHCRCDRCRLRKIMAPSIVFTVGVLFLFQSLNVVSFDRTWPAILLVVGVVKLLQSNASSAGHVGPLPVASTAARGHLHRLRRRPIPGQMLLPGRCAMSRSSVLSRSTTGSAASTAATPTRRSFAGPFVLIVLGIVFLLGNLHLPLLGAAGNVGFAHYWPLLLILWGVIKLIEHQQAQTRWPSATRHRCRRNLSRHSHRRLWAHRHPGIALQLGRNPRQHEHRRQRFG